MTEKILNKTKNGMAVLLRVLLGYVAAIAGVIFMASFGYFLDWLFVPVMAVLVLWLALGWILLCGLKVLKPQEALVLTLFGKYVGTLKGEGFYWVNPFCTAVNPAAKTKLNQSGDVDGGSAKPIVLSAGVNGAQVEMPSKKISLKIMTLNNARQKINDCLI